MGECHFLRMNKGWRGRKEGRKEERKEGGREGEKD